MEHVDEIMIVARYYERETENKYDALVALMELGLPRAQAADRICISKHAAYKILRYKLQELGGRQKEAIRKRDKYRCRICKAQCAKGDGKLHVHHKGDPTDDSPKNLISLCSSCHRKEDARLKKQASLNLSSGQVLPSKAHSFAPGTSSRSLTQ